MQSCIYEGTVAHRRLKPVVHQFQYRLFMVYLDLDELPALAGSGGVLPTGKYSSRSYRRGDHLFRDDVPLRQEVEAIIRTQTGETPRGPIRLLTQLRYFGYYFSPLNLFYVYDEHGRNVEYVVAEVNNTPWRERHCYVLWEGNSAAEMTVESSTACRAENRAATAAPGGVPRPQNAPARSVAVDRTLRFAHGKEFHVSPFLEMDFDYVWQLSEPGASASIELQNVRESQKVFEASLHLQRRQLTHKHLRRMTLRYPFMTAQVAAAIYYQALRLWCKRCPLFVHPKKRNKTASFRGAAPRTPKPVETSAP